MIKEIFKEELAKKAMITEFITERMNPELLKEVVSDLDLQHKGIDLILNLNDVGDIKVDIKCATNYRKRKLKEKSLQTFSQEISYNYKGSKIKGWLFSDKKETEYYLFSWLWSKNETKDSLKKDEILAIESFLVNRNEIISYLNEQGLNEKDIFDIEKRCRDGKLSEEEMFFSNDIRFCLSSHLPEKPFNIIINKEVLKEMSIETFSFTKNDDVKKQWNRS